MSCLINGVSSLAVNSSSRSIVRTYMGIVQILRPLGNKHRTGSGNSALSSFPAATETCPNYFSVVNTHGRCVRSVIEFQSATERDRRPLRAPVEGTHVDQKRPLDQRTGRQTSHD